MSSDKHKNRGIIPFAVLMDKPRMPQARTFPKQRIASKAENLIKTAKTELCCHKAWKTSQLQMFLTRVYTGYEAFLCFFPIFQHRVASNTLEKYGRVRNNTDKQSKQKQHSVAAAAAAQGWQGTEHMAGTCQTTETTTTDHGWGISPWGSTTRNDKKNCIYDFL